MTGGTMRPASARSLRPGVPVQALRAAPSFALWPATVVSVDAPSTIHHASPRVVVQFPDGAEQAYSGQGIGDYILTEVAS